ncbi:MAG: peptidylprolyl isomerase [Myxococcota bacterium]
MRRATILTLALVAVAGCKKEGAGPGGAVQAEGPWTTKAASGQELYATIVTNMGAVTVKLYSKDAPKTVRNFVGLATGERDWRNPATGELKKGVPLYAGTIFHRVIDGFMIQGGDPLGTGIGDPGYRFEDEVQSGKTFDRVGLLAMANSGPNTNGSQFFITTSTPQHLNGKHTIFGEVVKGYEVVEAISKVPRGPMDRPIQPVKIEKIELSEKAP